jgi:flagellar protein FlaG
MSINNISFQLPASGITTPSADTSNENNKEGSTVSTSYQELRYKKEYDMTAAEKNLVESVKKVLKEIDGKEIKLEFSVFKDLNQVMVKVINSETNEVIREIPPEKFLEMNRDMLKRAGLLIDQHL